MDGVTILNQYEVTTVTSAEINTVAFGITFLSIIIICSLVGFFTADYSYEGALFGLLIGLVLGAFIGLIAGAVCSEPSKIETTTQYEVTIDDSVSLAEFYEHYNVIEQRGKIFVVEKKLHE